MSDVGNSPQQWRAGAASVDITPAQVPGTLLAGFGLGRRATDARDPIEAGVLYLSDGASEIALVTLDLIGFLRPWVLTMRSRVQSMSGASVVPCATHTHSGPDTLGLWGPSILKLIPRATGRDPAYMDGLATEVAAAVDRAKASATDATLSVASVAMDPKWTRNDRKGGGRYDESAALFIDGVDGESMATLLNFASHPETLWEGNKRLSPDFPGAFRREMRRQGDGTPLYFSGPLGGMLTPNVDDGASFAVREAYMEDLGAALADATIAARSEAVVLEGSLVHRRRDWTPNVTNWRYRLAQKVGFADGAFDGTGVTTEVHQITVGDLTLITAPGEPTPEVGHRLAALAPTTHKMVLGLACDELGYMLTPAQWSDREWRYETTMSLGPHTADALIATHEGLLQ